MQSYNDCPTFHKEEYKNISWFQPVLKAKNATDGQFKENDAFIQDNVWLEVLWNKIKLSDNLKFSA